MQYFHCMKHLLLAAICLSSLTAFADGELIPDSPTDFTATFFIRSGEGIVRGQMKAPTTNYTYGDPEPLTQRIARIEVERSCWEIGDRTIVATFTNVVPGANLSFEDKAIPEYGYEYTYSATAYNSADEHAWSDATQYVFAGYKLQAPTFVSVTTSDKGLAPVNFTFKAEALTEEGESLDMPLTALKLYCEHEADDDDENATELIASIEDPESGKEYTATFEDAQAGMTYTFKLVSECAFGRSEYVSKEMYIGVDSPGSVTDLNVSPYGNGAQLTWEAPAEGRHNGWIDPEETMYRVERVVNYTPELIAEGIKECKYEDSAEDLTTLQAVKYRVTAYNAAGEGLYTQSDPITVGPAASIPFVEHFNTSSGYSVKPDNLWIESPEEYDWDCTDGAYYSGGAKGVLSENGKDEGYAYCSHAYAYGDKSVSYSTTPIDLTEAKYPVLTFWYLAKPDIENQLSVGYDTEGTAHVVMELCVSDEFAEKVSGDDTFVWVRRVAEMPEAAGTKSSIVFTASRKADGEYGNVCIDEVMLDDYPPVEEFDGHFDGTDGTLSWTSPSNSTGEPTEYDIEIDGEMAEPTLTNSLHLTGVSKEDHTLRVRARYGEIPSCWSNTFVFNPLTTGIASAIAAGSRTEYYDLTGMKREHPSRGEVVIKRTISPDGRVATSKIRL